MRCRIDEILEKIEKENPPEILSREINVRLNKHGRKIAEDYNIRRAKSKQYASRCYITQT